MKRFVSMLMLFVMSFSLVPACSTPDTGSDPWIDLVAAIDGMPPTQLAAAKRAQARLRARWDLERDYDDDDPVGRIDCNYADMTAVKNLRVADLLDCLERTYATAHECIDDIITVVDDGARSFIEPFAPGPNDGCKFQPDNRFQMRDEWRAERVTAEDLAREVAASDTPPAWMIAAGIVVAGVGGWYIVGSGWLAVLCAQGIDYGSCPQRPDGSGTTPGGSSTSGGDY